jgi:hypothetical protein
MSGRDVLSMLASLVAATPETDAAPEPLHDGLLALLGAAVGASVFAVGFASVRHHAALREARRHARLVRLRAAESVDLQVERLHLEHLVDDLGTRWVVISTLALAGAVVVGVAFGMHEDIGPEGYVALILFLVVELVVVVLGLADRQTAARRIPEALVTQDAKVLDALGKAPGSSVAEVARESGLKVPVARTTIAWLLRQGLVRSLDKGGFILVEKDRREAPLEDDSSSVGGR